MATIPPTSKTRPRPAPARTASRFRSSTCPGLSSTRQTSCWEAATARSADLNVTNRQGEKAVAGFLPFGGCSMRVKAWLLLLSSLLATGGTLASGDFDACKLIAPSEIEAVQGEAVLDAKSGERKTGGFAIAQCYYAPPPNTKSVSLEGTRPDPQQGTPSRPRDRWKKLFHREGGKEGEKE